MTELDRKRLRDAFTSYLPLPVSLEGHLREALDRVLLNPGSLVRPEIVLQVGLAYGLSKAEATDLAIGFEYFHTASLLFDDLPSMDNATERRGLTCVHVHLGDASAILAALALINRAYALTWRAVSGSPAERRTQALLYLERHLGVEGLLNGQSMDLHYATLPHDRKTIERIAMGKTVSLIRLTLVVPAILGGASIVEVQMLERVALFWGLSYQIVDDLKDVLQTSAETGKTASRDLSMSRPNLALVMGTRGAAERLERLIRLGDSMLHRLIAVRPGVIFLRTLREELRQEAKQIMQSACEPAVGWTA